MTAHSLKIAPSYYEAVEYGLKKFEIRKNDRDYQVGDVLYLRQWTPDKGYTGYTLWTEVTYILTDKDFPEGLQNGYCILGFDDVNETFEGEPVEDDLPDGFGGR